MNYLSQSVAVLACLVLLALACFDWWHRRLPNFLVLVLLALFGVSALVRQMDFAALAMHVGTGLAVFAVGVALYSLRQMGGGDAKLMGVVALWAGPSGLSLALANLAVGGLVLVGVGLAAQAMVSRMPLPRMLVVPLHNLSPIRGVPYGMALMVSGVTVISSQLLRS